MIKSGGGADGHLFAKVIILILVLAVGALIASVM
jgi:hypothetical protein